MTETNQPAKHDPHGEIASPATARSGSLVTAILFTGGLFVAVLSTRCRFDEIFTEFGYRELPAITNIVRSVFFLGFVGTLFSLTILKEFLLQNWPVRTAWNTFALIAVFVLGGVYVWGMCRPLIVLITNVSP